MGVLLVLTGIAFLNVVDWFSITTLGQWLIDTFPGLMKLEDWMTPAGAAGRDPPARARTCRADLIWPVHCRSPSR